MCPLGCEDALVSKAVERWDGTTDYILLDIEYADTQILLSADIALQCCRGWKGRSSTRHAMVPRATGGQILAE